MFAEPARTSPASLREGLYRDRGVTLEIVGLPSYLGDFDTLFAASVRAAPVVLGAFARYVGEAYSGPLPQPPATAARKRAGPVLAPRSAPCCAAALPPGPPSGGCRSGVKNSRPTPFSWSRPN